MFVWPTVRILRGAEHRLRGLDLAAPQPMTRAAHDLPAYDRHPTGALGTWAAQRS